MRTGYIHPQQARYRTQVELLQSQIDEASSTSEKVKLSKQLKKILRVNNSCASCNEK